MHNMPYIFAEITQTLHFVDNDRVFMVVGDSYSPFLIKHEIKIQVALPKKVVKHEHESLSCSTFI